VLLALLEEKKRGELVSSTKLAAEAGLSQQETARVLRLLESEGIIARSLVRGGQSIALTEKGMEFLESVSLQLEDLLGERVGQGGKLTFEALISSGMGDGAYYMSIEGYRTQLEKALGFKPYPGTLNLKIIGGFPTRKLLAAASNVKIGSFLMDNRIMGAIACVRATVKRGEREVRGALVFPERTHHPDDVVEFISDVRVRDQLGLKDGDTVVVSVTPRVSFVFAGRRLRLISVGLGLYSFVPFRRRDQPFRQRLRGASGPVFFVFGLESPSMPPGIRLLIS